ncbi:MAG: hypothetical protein ACRD28_03990 [Acidobacteriaceae bacterium]
MENVPARHKGRKVHPAPSVQSKPTEQSQQGVGFMFSMRPQLCNASRKLGIGQAVYWSFHPASA